MKIVSWNINGLRAWIKKDNVWDFLLKEKPDIVCLQEIKATKEQVNEFIAKEKEDFDNGKENSIEIKFFENHKYQYWNSAERRGYSGTAIFSNKQPLNVEYGIGDELDVEGRVITLEFDNYFLVNVYTPNSKPDLSRVDYRKDVWDKNFLNFLKKKEEKKPVITCGDFNVAHKEIDLKNPQSNKTTKTKPGSAGFTDKERESFEKYLKEGFIDTFRYLYPDKIQYSWWSYRFNARKNNSGWRIDYFLISQSLKKDLKDLIIYDKVLGSDHCPIMLVLR